MANTTSDPDVAALSKELRTANIRIADLENSLKWIEDDRDRAVKSSHELRAVVARLHEGMKKDQERREQCAREADQADALKARADALHVELRSLRDGLMGAFGLTPAEGRCHTDADAIHEIGYILAQIKDADKRAEEAEKAREEAIASRAAAMVENSNMEAALRGVHGISFSDGYTVNVAELERRAALAETAAAARYDEILVQAYPHKGHKETLRGEALARAVVESLHDWRATGDGLSALDRADTAFCAKIAEEEQLPAAPDDDGGWPQAHNFYTIIHRLRERLNAARGMLQRATGCDVSYDLLNVFIDGSGVVELEPWLTGALAAPPPLSEAEIEDCKAWRSKAENAEASIEGYVAAAQAEGERSDRLFEEVVALKRSRNGWRSTAIHCLNETVHWQEVARERKTR